jgi:hypothetical protein
VNGWPLATSSSHPFPVWSANAATEWFRVVNGQIKASNLIYDASAWRKVYAQMEK